MHVKTLKDIDFNEKRVLIRTDYNVPLDKEGNITDSKRIEDSLPTIKHILENNAKQLIIITHMGRPKQPEERLKTDNVAKKLSELIRRDVKKIDDWGENGLGSEKIIMLENARFNPKEKSKDENKRDEFAKKICANADVFVMEAFSNMHRGNQASMTSTLKFLPACLGIAAEKEISTITEAINNPKRPLVAIIGGAKADKLGTVENIMQHAEKILIGGALAFDILYATGLDMGDSKIDKENLENYSHVIEKIKESNQIFLPKDAIIANEFSDDAKKMIVPITEIKKGWMALDIGPETIKSFEEEIKNSGTIIWNGPLGVFEFHNFAKGTKEIAKAVSDSNAFSIIGGGDSAAAIHNYNLLEKVGFVSSGGGASLMMFEGKKLPVLEKMEENFKNFTA